MRRRKNETKQKRKKNSPLKTCENFFSFSFPSSSGRVRLHRRRPGLQPGRASPAVSGGMERGFLLLSRCFRERERERGRAKKRREKLTSFRKHDNKKKKLEPSTGATARAAPPPPSTSPPRASSRRPWPAASSGACRTRPAAPQESTASGRAGPSRLSKTTTRAPRSTTGPFLTTTCTRATRTC